MRTKLISKKLIYPKNGNWPTEHYEFECACGKGKIIEENVPCFNDHYTWIACEECKKKYVLIEGRGSIWEICPKDSDIF